MEQTMNKNELMKLENYLVSQFGSDFQLKLSKSKDSAEVYVHNEFVGTIYKDEDEGEVSYTFTMSILDIDLA